MGDEDMAEWHEEISDDFFEFADFCEGEAAKASKEIREIIYSSDNLIDVFLTSIKRGKVCGLYSLFDSLFRLWFVSPVPLLSISKSGSQSGP